MEPDYRRFEFLRAIGNVLPRFKALNSVVGREESMVGFYVNDAVPDGSNVLMPSNTTVSQVRLDDVAPDATFIKMDVEGYEIEVLCGAEKIISHNAPSMAVTTYHYPHDFFNIMEKVAELHCYKNIALRHYSMHLTDLVYLFSDAQSFV